MFKIVVERHTYESKNRIGSRLFLKILLKKTEDSFLVMI